MKPEFDKAQIGLLAISADLKEDSEEFIADKSITVPLLSDPNLVAISAYGVAMEGEDIAVPATFLIDGKGDIQWRHIGENMTDRPGEEALLDMAKRIQTQHAEP